MKDKLQTIQKKINFIAAEIREHKIELYRLHKELQKAKIKSLYEKHKNQTGRGISQFREGHHGNQYPLEDICEGKHPEYPTWKLLKRLIKHKEKDECCEICNFQEKRKGDGKVPLILGFDDRNKLNRKLENLIVMCYNCFFIHQGKLAGGKDAPYPRKNSTLLKQDNLDEQDYEMLRNL